jgi:membrane-associated phospholipid phosphatase
VSERVRRSLAAGAACVLALLVLGPLASDSPAFRQLDERAVQRISGSGRPADPVARIVAHLGDPLAQLALLAAASLLSVGLGRRGHALLAIALVAGASLTTQLLKPAFAESRFSSLLGYWQPSPNSFPSGHTTAMAAMALAFVLIVPRPWRWASAAVGGLLTIAVGWSVVALRRHYPSDVVGGVLVAFAWFFVVLPWSSVPTPGRSSTGKNLGRARPARSGPGRTR